MSEEQKEFRHKVRISWWEYNEDGERRKRQRTRQMLAETAQDAMKQALDTIWDGYDSKGERLQKPERAASDPIVEAVFIKTKTIWGGGTFWRRLGINGSED